MSYSRTIWKDRKVEKPKTYKIQNNDDGTVTLIPREGTIVEPGTPLNAENMNNIESGVEALKSIYGDVSINTSLWAIARDSNPNNLNVYLWNKVANKFLALQDNGEIYYGGKPIAQITLTSGTSSALLNAIDWKLYRSNSDGSIVLYNTRVNKHLALYDDGRIAYDGKVIAQITPTATNASEILATKEWTIFRNPTAKNITLHNKVGDKYFTLWDDGKMSYAGSHVPRVQFPAFEQSVSLGKNQTITVAHNLGYKPIVEVGTTLGNVQVTWQHIDINTIKLYNYSASNDATAYIRCY